MREAVLRPSRGVWSRSHCQRLTQAVSKQALLPCSRTRRGDDAKAHAIGQSTGPGSGGAVEPVWSGRAHITLRGSSRQLSLLAVSPVAPTNSPHFECRSESKVRLCVVAHASVSELCTLVCQRALNVSSRVASSCDSRPSVPSSVPHRCRSSVATWTSVFAPTRTTPSLVKFPHPRPFASSALAVVSVVHMSEYTHRSPDLTSYQRCERLDPLSRESSICKS